LRISALLYFSNFDKRFFVKHGNKQPAVGKIYLVLRFIIIAFERKFGKVKAVTDICHAGVGEPFDTTAVIFKTCVMCDF